MERHVVVATPPAPGHVYPVLAVIEELVDRGDRVTMITSRSLAAAVQATGARVVEVGWEPDTSQLADQEFSIEVLLNDMNGYLDAARRVLPELLDALADDPPSVVCHDSVMLGPLLASMFSVPSVSLVANFAMNEHVRPDAFMADFDPAHPGLADYGRRVGELFAQHRVTPPDPRRPAGSTLVFVPREFQIGAETFDDTYHFIGPTIARSRAEDWTPPGDGPVVLVSMGTAFTRRPHVFRAAVEGLADTDWQVIVAVGEHLDPEALNHSPRNVHIAPRVPQPAVLRQAQAFVSHAGMGSVMEALLNEVPVIAIPFAAEQRLNAERVAELGLGLHLSDPTPDQLRDAVNTVAHDPLVRTRLADMRTAIRNGGGAAAGADTIQAGR